MCIADAGGSAAARDGVVGADMEADLRKRCDESDNPSPAVKNTEEGARDHLLMRRDRK